MELQRRGHSVTAVFDPVAVYRNDLIARSKVNLVPKQGGGMNQLPFGRIAYQVSNRCVTVVERCKHQESLQDLFVWAESEDYVDRCEQILALDRAERDALADRHHDLFADRPLSAKLVPLMQRLESRIGSTPTPV
jgi:hypothetical protein